MISNIPTHTDFYDSGKELLVLSWDIVAKLLLNFDEATKYFDVEAEESKYWLLADRKVKTALAIMQQGMEFILKGRICEVSPYLLIFDAPSRCKVSNAGENMDFSKFRTIDAQDLIKVCNTFSNEELDPAFITKFEELRLKRNTIMHSIGSNLRIDFIEVIKSLLYMHKVLFPNESWAMIRKNSLLVSPDIELGSVDYIANEVCREFSVIIDLLSPAEVKNYFKVDKGKRAYYCPDCYNEANHDMDFTYKLARLSSRDMSCNTLYCPICDENFEVLRKPCPNNKFDDCPGNVLCNDESICLTCGYY